MQCDLRFPGGSSLIAGLYAELAVHVMRRPMESASAVTSVVKGSHISRT